jgi:glycosyltransferase involved in cell wall biosynthesis
VFKDRLNFKGFVDNITRELANKDMYLAPMYADVAIKNKVLEAAMVGLPIIATREAVRGCYLRPGIDYVLCESLQEFVQAIDNLSKNEEMRAKLGTSARNFVHREVHLGTENRKVQSSI